MSKFGSSHHWLLPCLILLTITMEIGSADILLPALKNLQDFYQVSNTQIEKLISLNLFALAFSSLLYGPLSDRFGRRTIYLLGVSLFTIMSIWLCLYQSFKNLLILRFVQGLGGGVCATVGLAMLKDRYDSKDYTKVLSWISVVITTSPVIYPLIGSYLLVWGWEYIFYFTAILAIVVVCLLVKFLPETTKKNVSNFSEYSSLYIRVVSHKHFILYATICGLTYAVTWVYIAQISLLAVKTYGFKPEHLGWILGISVLFAILGSYIQTKIVNYFSIDYCLGIGIAIALMSALGMALIFLQVDSFAVIVGCSSLYWLSNSIIFTNASSLALDIFPKTYGIAASYLTASELLWSATAVWLGAKFYDETVMPIVWITLSCAVLMSIVFVLNLRKSNR